MTEQSHDFITKVDRSVYPMPEYRHPRVKISTTYADSVSDFPPTANGA